MPVNLSIKSVPDDLATGLRDRAARNHRSLQGELMAIVEAAVQSPPVPGIQEHLRGTMTPLEVLAAVRKLGLKTESDSTAIIRADRDERY